MPTRLLERAHEVAQLAAAAWDAAAGRGCVVLVHGEAGVGKSSLVETVRTRMPAKGRMLVGRCDDLATPRTLGPLRDLVGAVGRELAGALRAGADRDLILSALFRELSWAGQPTVLVVEDVHWADEATLDVLCYLGRRVAQLPVAVVLTYRDDELGAGHPLRRLLGSVAGNVRRLPLRPLTAESVREVCAGRDVDADAVFAITGGNPFFVDEVVATGATSRVSPTVVDVVLARLDRLDTATRQAVEQLSVVPTAIGRALVDRLVPGGLVVLSAAEELGLLAVTAHGVAFRHELTRRAIVDTMPAIRRSRLNARVLAVLVEDPGADVARIVHHAAQAHDRAAILRYGPQAARAAAAGGAHREAAAHYRSVLAHVEELPRGEQAAILEAFAVECYTLGDGDGSVSAQRRAVELRRALGATAALGAALRWLSRMHWWNGNRPAAEAAAVEAVQVLESAGNARVLGMAVSNQAQLEMLALRAAQAVPLATRAVALARASGDATTLSHALNNLGLARGLLREPDGRGLLEESLRVALAGGDVEQVCRAYLSLARQLVDGLEFDEAERFVDAGSDVAERTEHIGFLDYFLIVRARIALAHGRWDDAVTWASEGMSRRAVYRCAGSVVIGQVAARRGDPDAADVLTDAVELGVGMGEPQWAGPAAAAIAECVWLGGAGRQMTGRAVQIYDEAVRLDAPIRTELGYWLTKAGAQPVLRPSDEPYGLLASGRWREAAAGWEAAGCPYEQAMAMGESPCPRDVLAAVEQLDALDAVPLARIARRRLRDLGVLAVPRGPTSATRRNPAGLTRRQREVLELVAHGLTNAEIAARLVVSVRTAGNHVAAVLDKLGVHSRADAAARWAELAGDEGVAPERSNRVRA